jgi:mono/diheme cytochrome c family protein
LFVLPAELSLLMRRPGFFAIVVLYAVSAAASSPLTPAETRGRRIYRHGESVSGRAITAQIGGGELGASVFPCATCHGADGRGVPEGTVEPPDVRWRVLTNILVPPDGQGRRRPRYDEALFARALQHGVDAGGNRLSAVMPRYRMAGADLADLVAYLKRLGDEPQPGVSDTALAVATLDARARPVLEAFLADVNAQGGIHGRALQLKDAAGDVFAIIGAAAPEESVAARIRDESIPLITPLPFDSPPPSAFFLFSDAESQAAALRQHFGGDARTSHVLHRTADWDTVAANKNDDDLLLLVGSGVDTSVILRRLAALQWRPRVLIAGASLPPEILDAGPSFRDRIFLAAPTLPTDATADARRELLAFIARHHLPATQLAATMATVAAGRVFVDGLKRAGRELTREKLIASLETLYQFNTGLTPPVSYARGRHAGATGAYIVAVDVDRRTFVPMPDGWIRPRQ